MPLPAFLRTTFTQTVHVAARTGASSKGDPTFAAPVAYLCRSERIQKRMVNVAGEEVVATAHVNLLPEASVGQSDRFWLPGDSTADPKLARVPVQVNEAVAEGGDRSHWEVFL